MSTDQKIIGASKNIGNSDQAVTSTGFRNLDLGGNTSSDGLKIRNQALTIQHEFNGVGDYRLITGRFAMGGGLTSANYGAIFNKTGSAGNIFVSNSNASGRCIYALKSGTGGNAVLISNSGGGNTENLYILGTGSGGTRKGIFIDVSGATTNRAIEIANGDFKVPSGIGQAVTLNFNAPNSGDTASMTFEKGILISHTETA